jgi:hypothetical protein
MGPIATPLAIKFVAALPKPRSGKIMRRLLKAQETGAEIGDLSTLEQIAPFHRLAEEEEQLYPQVPARSASVFCGRWPLQ